MIIVNDPSNKEAQNISWSFVITQNNPWISFMTDDICEFDFKRLYVTKNT